MIKGKSPDQIRAEFDIPNDFTAEELEDVRRYVAMFEAGEAVFDVGWHVLYLGMYVLTLYIFVCGAVCSVVVGCSLNSFLSFRDNAWCGKCALSKCCYDSQLQLCSAVASRLMYTDGYNLLLLVRWMLCACR